MNPFMQKLGVLAVTLSAFLSASAYDFEVDGIYYNITDRTAKTVEVTYEKGTYTASYSGDIVIPASVSYNDEQYTVTAIGWSAFCECRSLTSIIIPNSVTTIRSEAFYGCSSLTSISLPEYLTTIQESTFQHCSSLSSISIPNSVTAIMGSAFENCNSLASIIIPNSVKTIGVWAFYGCDGLTLLSIPQSVTDIKYGAFSMCHNMTKIDVDVENKAYSSVNGLLYDKSQTYLVCCPGGTSETITIPNSVTTIGRWSFAGCSNLTSITLPNSVTTIEDRAFNACRSLTSITLQSSVTTIGQEAFACCSALTRITSHTITPPECGISALKDIDKQLCTLYVPKGCKEAYQQAPQWKDFVYVDEVEAAGIEAVEAVADGAVEVLNLTGVKVADSTEGLPAGIYLVRRGSTIRKVAVK